MPPCANSRTAAPWRLRFGDAPSPPGGRGERRPLNLLAKIGPGCVMLTTPPPTGRSAMALSDQQRKFYEQTMAVTRQEMDDLDRQIEEEMAKVRERLAELQDAKK